MLPRMAVRRYASIFVKKYGRLVRYAFFVMVQVRHVGTVRFKNLTEYGTVQGARYVARKFLTYRTVLQFLVITH